MTRLAGSFRRADTGHLVATSVGFGLRGGRYYVQVRGDVFTDRFDLTEQV
ncbi:MAG TPA: hypothetical protein VKI00_33310 [Mycobacterium sp.]|nr:hypothetical protein [Mycobacterium sp.]HME80371.1 hypothetical protein [Mycobacterium sp.]